MTLGSHRNPLPPVVGKKIYNSMCIPKLLYGLEACTLTDDCLLVLERSHRYGARKIQGLPPQTPIVVPLATLGLHSVESMMHCQRMIMLYRWLALPISCIYKQTVIARLTYHLAEIGPHMGAIYEALQVCRMYELEEYVISALETGLTLPKSRWKQMVNRVVKDKEMNSWQATVLLYGNLSMFQECITSIGVSVWWHVSRCRPHLTMATRILMRLVCGQHGLAVNVAHFKNKGTENSGISSELCII